MRFKRFGRLNPSLTNEIRPLEFADRAVLKRLDYLLGYLQARDLQAEFVEKLNLKLCTQVNGSPVVIDEIDTSVVCAYPNLAGQLELVELHLKFFGQLLQTTAIHTQGDATITVSNRNYLRAYLVSQYYHALVLTEMIGKANAISLLKEFIDEYIVSVQDLIQQVDDLEAVRAMNIPQDPESAEGMIFVASDIEGGKWMIRNDNCLWIEALDDLDDPDLIYVVCCHGDFIYAEMMNENFVFTRKYTIAEGHPYCDKVFHDKRFSDLKHPDKEFWESLDSRLES